MDASSRSSTCLAGKRGKVQYFGLRGTEETLKKSKRQANHILGRAGSVC